MNAIQPQKDYDEKYWTTGHARNSGDNRGCAAHLRNGVNAQLRGIAGDAAILEVGGGDGSFTRSLARHSSPMKAVDISVSQIERNAALTRRNPVEGAEALIPKERRRRNAQPWTQTTSSH